MTGLLALLLPLAAWAQGTESPSGVSLARSGAGDCSGSGFDTAHSSIFAGPWQRLESGLNHQCGLKADSSIECWGNNLIDGQLANLPASTEQFRALSVGYNHACAIRTNGQLACWGSNVNGQATPPTGTFVQVAAGNTFTCGIRDNGIRVCWGAGAGVAVTLLPGTLPNGTAGTAYANQQFSLSGDAANLPANPVYAVSSGSLPDGLSLTTGLNLTAGGLLSGTPTMAGTFTFSVDAEGEGDFGATQSYTVTIIADSTPPQIAYVFNPATPNGKNGWYRGNVGIDWAVSDPDSGIAGSSGCNDATLSSDTAGASWTCIATNNAGLQTSVTTATIKRDGTTPTLNPTVPDPLLLGHGYSASPNASDATSGLASASCGALDTSSTGNKSTTCNAADKAGNTNTVQLDYTVTTTCVNDGYKGAQLTWYQNICENGLTGQVLDTWVQRWVSRYRDLPYCRVEAN